MKIWIQAPKGYLGIMANENKPYSSQLTQEKPRITQHISHTKAIFETYLVTALNQ